MHDNYYFNTLFFGRRGYLVLFNTRFVFLFHFSNINIGISNYKNDTDYSFRNKIHLNNIN